jgi:hypothetical protein
MDICLDTIICEAKCCSANIASKYIRAITFGNDDKALYFDLRRLNAYIKTLQRNKVKIITSKQLVSTLPKKVSLDSLQKKNKTLYLKAEPEEQEICVKTEILPCLTDSEIQKIIEEIRLLCSTCNCNCK